MPNSLSLSTEDGGADKYLFAKINLRARFCLLFTNPKDFLHVAAFLIDRYLPISLLITVQVVHDESLLSFLELVCDDFKHQRVSHTSSVTDVAH